MAFGHFIYGQWFDLWPTAFHQFHLSVDDFSVGAFSPIASPLIFFLINSFWLATLKY
jgi:hypothetical protein